MISLQAFSGRFQGGLRHTDMAAHAALGKHTGPAL